MKTAVTVLAIMFALSFAAPVFAEDDVAGVLCDPKKMEECQTKIDNLIQSVDSLKARLLKTQLELKAGRKLTNAEADRLLERVERVDRTLPTTEGFMWDN